VLDFHFAVAERYMCDRHSLRTGRLEFDFRCGRRQLRAVRVSLAGTLLRKTTLADWARSEARLGKGDRTETLEAEFKSHPAADIRGTRAGRLPYIGRRKLRLLAWHCAESNALYLAHGSGPAREPEEFTAFADSFACH